MDGNIEDGSCHSNNTETMRGIVFNCPLSVSCSAAVEKPSIIDPHDAIVRVMLAGLCGSDLHPYRGNEIGIESGTVMGHEFVGQVVEVGSAVREISVGEKVCAPFTVSCGNCYYCLKGFTARCEKSQLFGWIENGKGIHGCQSEYVRVPHADGTLVKVPDGLHEEECLLLGDVLPTGLFASIQAHAIVGGDEDYVVLGCGPVGLMAIVAAKELGARVFAVDMVEERLLLAKSFGAQPIVLRAGDNGESVVQTVLEHTNGRGCAAILDCVGAARTSRYFPRHVVVAESATTLGYKLVRPFGVISIVGVHNEPSFSISPTQAYDKNLTIRIGRCPARALLSRALDIIRTGKYPLRSLFSHRFTLEDAEEAYRMFDSKSQKCTKVVFYPHGLPSEP